MSTVVDPPLSIGVIAKRAQTRLDARLFAEAEPDLKRLAMAMPETVGVLKLLMAVESILGRIGAAGRRCRWLFTLAPDDLNLVRNAISLPLEADLPPDNIRRLLMSEPGIARAYAVLGAGTDRRWADGRIKAAIVEPTDPDFLALAAAHHLDRGTPGRARERAQRALCLNPATVDGYLILAERIRSAGDPQSGLALAERALMINRSVPEAWITVAICAHRLARSDDARDAMGSAMVLRPRDAAYAARAATLLPHIVMSCDEMSETRERIDKLVDQDGFDPIVNPVQQVGTVPFALAYHGINDRALLQRLCGFYRRVCPSLTMTAPHIGRARRPGRRRVAFVSEFFRNHSVFNMTEGHLRMMDRTEIEISLVQIGYLPAETNALIGEYADRVMTVPADLDAVRRALAELELDVLIFADIGMTAMSYFLAFARLAPLQVVLPGHPVTTGIDTVDVFFTSAWMEPEDYGEHYSETPHRVDGLAVAYAAERIRYQPVARGEVGLPGSGALYLCGQMPFKIHPDFDRMIGDILTRDPAGVVALFDAPGDFLNIGTPLMRRIRAANADRPAVMDRLRVLPRLSLERYIGLMKAADVVLDTVHFSGGNTTMQSLALGQPLVALPTSMMRGRVAAAPLHAMGLEADLLATSGDDYVERAVRIATDEDLARDLRSRLADASPTLIDSDAGARSLTTLITTGTPTG